MFKSLLHRCIRYGIFHVLLSLIFLSSVFYLHRFQYFKYDNDFNAMLPIWNYIASYLHNYHYVPDFIPFVGSGIPTIAEPLSVVMHPIFFFSMYFFPVNMYLFIVIFITIASAGYSFYFYSKKYISNLYICFSLSLIYMFSSTAIAQIVSGHLPVLLSMVALPIVLFSSLRVDLTYKEVIISSVAIASMIYAGDLYFPFLCFIFVISGFISRVYVHKLLIKELLLLLSLIFGIAFFSSIKLIPLVLYVKPIMERFFPILPYEGSLHLIYFFIPFMIPFASEFYDRPSLQYLFGFYYNWHEYSAFIPPILFVFIYPFVKYRTNSYGVNLLILNIIIGMFYVANKYWYSPFHWLIEYITFAQTFRVPQRMYVIMLTYMLLLIGIGIHKAQRYSHNKTIYLILIISIISQIINSYNLFNQGFANVRDSDNELVRNLKLSDSNTYYVTTFVCCMQSFLAAEQIPVLNYYYGWRQKGMPNFLSSNGKKFNFSSLNLYKSKYVITDSQTDLHNYNYYIKFSTDDRILWQTDSATITPAL